MTPSESAAIRKEIAQIHETLDSIENYMIWLIKPEQRFRPGQRVEWSRRARSRGFPRRKCAQRGTIQSINGFCVVVALDGLRHAKSFHHAFFNPLGGSKLF